MCTPDRDALRIQVEREVRHDLVYSLTTRSELKKTVEDFIARRGAYADRPAYPWLSDAELRVLAFPRPADPNQGPDCARDLPAQAHVMYWDEIAALWDQVPAVQNLSDKFERYWLLYVAIDALHGLGEARTPNTVDAFLREYVALLREWGARYPHVDIQPHSVLERTVFDHVPAIELVCYMKKNGEALKKKFVSTSHRSLRDVLAAQLELKDAERRCSVGSGICESPLRLHPGIE